MSNIKQNRRNIARLKIVLAQKKIKVAPALQPEDVSGNAGARGVVNCFPAATNHRILLTPPLERKGKECEAYSGNG